MIQDPVVADFLPQTTQAPVEQMNKGMEEKKCLNKSLDHVDRAVPPTNVGELVKQDRAELLLRHLARQSLRQKDDRAKNSDGYRRGDTFPETKLSSRFETCRSFCLIKQVQNRGGTDGRRRSAEANNAHHS